MCYDTQMLSSPFKVKKQRSDQPSPQTFNQKNAFFWLGLRKNARVLLTLLLTVQFITTQALGSNNYSAATISEEYLDFSEPTGREAEAFSNDSAIPKLSTSDIEEISSQFEKVKTDLMVIAEIFNKDSEYAEHIRIARKVNGNFAQRSTCTVSMTKLTELKNTIDNQLSESKISQTGSSLCEYSNSSPNNCNELVKLIQCGIDKLQSKFIEASVNNVPFSEYVVLQNAHNKLVEEFANIKDDLERSISQEYQTRIEQLETNNQNLANALNKAIDKLKKEKINFCRSEIHSGRIDSSVAAFKDLNDESLLASIVDSAYNYLSDSERNSPDKKLDNFGNIAMFIRNLPLISQGAIGYTTLYEVMKSNNHLKGPQMFTLSELIKEYINMKYYSSVSQDYKNKFLALKDCADNVIADWATRIRSGNHQKIKDMLNNYKDDCGAFVNNFWDQIIKESYAGIDDVENILAFIRTLPCIKNTARAVSSLFEQMKMKNHVDSYQYVMVASKIKIELSFVEKTHDEQYYRGDGRQYYLDTYNNMKSQLPSGIKALLWDPFVVIKSRLHNDFALFSDNFREIFTKSYDSDSNKQRWDVSVHDNGRYFQFKNREYEAFLYSKDESALGSKVCNHNDCYWEVKPIENGEFVYFKNKGSNRILDCNDLVSILFFATFSKVHAYERYTGTKYQQWIIK